MLFNISANQLFPNKIDLYFRSSLSTCCGKSLKIYNTITRKKSTFAIGDFKANITKKYCETCGTIYGGEELNALIPKGSHFGYDIIEYIGQSLFIDHRGDEEIQLLLREKNISISLREISYLGKKFIVYLALAHQSCRDKIKNHMKSKGGYILHLDGTCEGDSPHLFSFIDEISRIVLDNIKIASENTKLIKPNLQELKKNYGNPVAIVHDMKPAIINAVESIFPDVANFICHYHFLRDIGKDLFGIEYNSIKRCLQSSKVRSLLRKFSRELKNYIMQNDELKICLDKSVQRNFFENSNNSHIMVPVSCYLLVTWVLESRNKSHGYGFPFDRSHVDFYDRLKVVYPILKNLKIEMPSDSPKLSLKKLNYALSDPSLINALTMIRKKISIFDELREAMRIVLPDGKNGLNDSGDDIDMKIIESGVKKFRESEKIIELSKNDLQFKKMVKQIDKYWEKLFADPIIVKTETGDIIMKPQRTNNMLEQFFRDIKSGNRKKSGTSSLSKSLKAMLANTPLVKNLKIPEYEKIILNGKNSLAERFAEIDVIAVRAELQREDDAARKYPKGMARIFRLPDLPNKISQLGQKMIENG